MGRGAISRDSNFNINAMRAELRQLFRVGVNPLRSSPTDDDVMRALEVDAEMRAWFAPTQNEQKAANDEEMDVQTEEDELADYLQVACHGNKLIIVISFLSRKLFYSENIIEIGSLLNF